VLPLKYAPNANLKKNARLAKQFTVQWLRDHEEKGVTLSRVLRGKYFRYIATVTSDGENLGQQLIDNGHAVPYYGGTRTDWCK
jgi:endonuclease YncB( thermonuclease family)